MINELLEEESSNVKEEKENRLYTKDEVQSLMRRRVLRSHQAFFDRYGVNSLEELDNLFFKINELEKEKKRKEEIEEFTYKVKNIMVGHQKQVEYALSLIGYLKKENPNMIYEKGSLFVLKGKEGTGKEYFSSIIHKILTINNIIDDDFNYIDASDFTFTDIDKFFDKKRNSFVVIDSFDLLLEDNDVFEGNERQEKLKKFLLNLNSFMEKSYVCLLGKEKPINEFLSKYKLFREYVACNLDFTPYNSTELTQIAACNLRENGYDLSGIDFDTVKGYMEQIMKLKSFKEAYSAIEYRRRVKDNQNRRTLDNKLDKQLLIDDFKNALKEMENNEKN